jgi:hypothetical protein
MPSCLFFGWTDKNREQSRVTSRPVFERETSKIRSRTARYFTVTFLVTLSCCFSFLKVRSRYGICQPGPESTGSVIYSRPDGGKKKTKEKNMKNNKMMIMMMMMMTTTRNTQCPLQSGLESVWKS